MARGNGVEHITGVGLVERDKVSLVQKLQGVPFVKQVHSAEQFPSRSRRGITIQGYHPEKHALKFSCFTSHGGQAFYACCSEGDHHAVRELLADLSIDYQY